MPLVDCGPGILSSHLKFYQRRALGPYENVQVDSAGRWHCVRFNKYTVRILLGGSNYHMNVYIIEENEKHSDDTRCNSFDAKGHKVGYVGTNFN